MNFKSLSNGTMKHIVRDRDVRSDNFADAMTRLSRVQNKNIVLKVRQEQVRKQKILLHCARAKSSPSAF